MDLALAVHEGERIDVPAAADFLTGDIEAAAALRAADRDLEVGGTF